MRAAEIILAGHLEARNSQHYHMNSPNLRTRLQDITCSHDIDGHPSAIEKLRSEFPHTIQLVERTNPTLPRNCYEWALDLSSVLTHWVGELDLPELFAGPQFASTLIPQLNAISESDVRNDDLVLYFDEPIPTHAGLATESRVISKWGEGHIYKHGFMEVPASYGDTIRFYQRVPSDLATMRFIEYVRQHPDYEAIREIFEDKLANLSPT